MLEVSDLSHSRLTSYRWYAENKDIYLKHRTDGLERRCVSREEFSDGLQHMIA